MFNTLCSVVYYLYICSAIKSVKINLFELCYLVLRQYKKYVLLPTMQHANAEILLQAIDDMVEYYKDDESKLGRQLLWLSILLHRAEIVPMQDKHIIEDR